MLKRSMISAGFLGAFVILAFGSGTDSAVEDKFQSVADSLDDNSGSATATATATGNQAACVAYIEHFNGLSCVIEAGKQDPATMCPKELDLAPNDMASFYKCMQDGSTCNGDVLDASKASTCKPGQ